MAAPLAHKGEIFLRRRPGTRPASVVLSCALLHSRHAGLILIHLPCVREGGARVTRVTVWLPRAFRYPPGKAYGTDERAASCCSRRFVGRSDYRVRSGLAVERVDRARTLVPLQLTESCGSESAPGGGVGDKPSAASASVYATSALAEPPAADEWTADYISLRSPRCFGWRSPRRARGGRSDVHRISRPGSCRSGHAQRRSADESWSGRGWSANWRSRRACRTG